MKRILIVLVVLAVSNIYAAQDSPAAVTNTAEAVKPKTVTATGETATPESVSSQAEISVPAAVSPQAETAAPEAATGTAGDVNLRKAGAATTAKPEKKVIVIHPDTSDLNEISLIWNSTEPGLYYNVFRKMDGGNFEMLTKKPLTIAAYTDEKITTSTAYFYKVEEFDMKGNTTVSEETKAVTGNLLLPYKPGDFKALQDIENVVLKWTGASQGTYAVSGYNIYRGRTQNDIKFYKFVDNTVTKCDDEDVEAATKYYYKLRAVDIEGNESEETDIYSAVPFPIPRTGLILSPTARRNDIYNNYGLNIDIMFSYYIGTLYDEYDHPIYGKKTEPFNKIGVWLLTGDAKWTFFNDFELIPSVGIGYIYRILLQDKIGSNSAEERRFQQEFNVSKEGRDSLIQMQGFYTVISKKAVFDISLHGGYHFGNQTAYFPYFSKLLYGGEVSQNAYFAGLSRALFSRMGIKIDYTVPIGVNKNPVLPDYYLINTHIDRFINFDIGYFHHPYGYSWMGYISFRFTIFPNPYK